MPHDRSPDESVRRGSDAAVEGAAAARTGTPQGPQAAGPGNRHGLPPGDALGPSGGGEHAFGEEGCKPTADPEEAAKRFLEQRRSGPPAEGDAGPLGAAGRPEASPPGENNSPRR